MKRKSAGLIFAAAVLAAAAAALSPAPAATVEAAGVTTSVDMGSVVFDGSKLENNFSTKDMTQEVSGIEPGDAVELRITLKNTSSGPADFYMKNQILKSLEDSSDAEGGAYTYTLTSTTPDGAVTTHYDSIVGGDSTEGGEGLNQADSALGEYFRLMTLKSGQTGYVTLTVKLDEETVGDAYMNTLADLSLSFAAEADTTTSPSTTASSSATAVKTGDHAMPMLYVCLALFSLGLVLMILAMRRLREENGGRLRAAEREQEQE